MRRLLRRLSPQREGDSSRNHRSITSPIHHLKDQPGTPALGIPWQSWLLSWLLSGVWDGRGGGRSANLPLFVQATRKLMLQICQADPVVSGRFFWLPGLGYFTHRFPFQPLINTPDQLLRRNGVGGTLPNPSVKTPKAPLSWKQCPCHKGPASDSWGGDKLSQTWHLCSGGSPASLPGVSKSVPPQGIPGNIY